MDITEAGATAPASSLPSTPRSIYPSGRHSPAFPARRRPPNGWRRVTAAWH